MIRKKSTEKKWGGTKKFFIIFIYLYMCVVAQEAEVNLHELQQEGPWDRTWSAKLGNKVPLSTQQPPKLFLQSLS